MSEVEEDAAAAQVLGYAELAAWQRVSDTTRYRGRWLRGRIAAKHAIRHVLQSHAGLPLPLKAITVLPGEHGQPVVYLPLPGGIPIKPMVSITHCGSTSVALAALDVRLPILGIGIDIASPAEDHEGLAEGGFADQEIALLDGVSAAERRTWLLRLWCAKEALGKALGRGLMGDPRRLHVRRIDPHLQQVAITAVNAPHGQPWPVGGDQTFVAHVGFSRGLVFGVAGFD